MAISKKSNPVPTLTEAKVSPADILRSVVIAAGATRTAALTLCYAAAAFILRVNHFADVKSKEYMTRSDAVEYLQKEVQKQAGVQGNMLGIYIRNASTLAGVLTGSMKMFSPTIQELANATTADDMAVILSDWMEKNNGRRIESLSSLSEALGYKTSRPTPVAKMTAETAVQTVDNAIKKVEKAIADKGLKVKESTIAQTMVSRMTNKSTIAREAIKAITEVEELHALIVFIKEQEKLLKARNTRASEAAQESVKDTPKTKTAGATRPRRAPAHTQA